MTPLLTLTWLRISQVVRAEAALAVVTYTLLAALLLPVLADLSLGAADRTVVDLGLLAARTAGALTALIAGLGTVGPTVRRGEATTWLVLPISRSSWVLARWTGTVAASIATMVLCVGVWHVVAGLLGVRLPADLGSYLLAGTVELTVLASMSTLAGAALPTPLATLSTIVAVTLGHVGGVYADITSPNWTLRTVGQGVRWIVPQLDRYNLQAELIYDLPVAPSTLAFDALHGVAWTLALILGTCLVLSRRDL
ncbi:MAG: Cu-processing system permease protein [Kiritimatiellia bacterium]|jgi:Cu-processing system permease protein